MGHGRKEGTFYAKKPILQHMRNHSVGETRTLCVSDEAATEVLRRIEKKLSKLVSDANQVRNGLSEKSLCVAHFTLATDARRKAPEPEPAESAAKKKRGRPRKTANK